MNSPDKLILTVDAPMKHTITVRGNVSFPNQPLFHSDFHNS